MERCAQAALAALSDLSRNVVSDSLTLARRQRELDRQSRRLEDIGRELRTLIAVLSDVPHRSEAAGASPPT
jgi:hypothetical protein